MRFTQRSRRRAAFTFVEVLTVMALIGLLVQIAVPHYTGMKKRAFTAAIFNDVHSIRIAALSAYHDANSFPADAAAGTVPPPLVPHLPSNFTFVKSSWTYDWDTWTSSDGEMLVGVKVTSSDAELITLLVRAGGSGLVPVGSGTGVTFLLASD